MSDSWSFWTQELDFFFESWGLFTWNVSIGKSSIYFFLRPNHKFPDVDNFLLILSKNKDFFAYDSFIWCVTHCNLLSKYFRAFVIYNVRWESPKMKKIYKLSKKKNNGNIIPPEILSDLSRCWNLKLEPRILILYQTGSKTVNKYYWSNFQITCRRAIQKKGTMSLQSLTG